MGVLTRAGRDALAAYCRFVALFTEASALLQNEPLVIEGDRGCRVRNPALIVQRDAAQMMLKLAAEFGLTPRARAEIRVPP
ncbi:MAG: phage terminase small subunit P27 family, partial [Candidatus Sericytochromatia bacterium]